MKDTKPFGGMFMKEAVDTPEKKEARKASVAMKKFVLGLPGSVEDPDLKNSRHRSAGDVDLQFKDGQRQTIMNHLKQQGYTEIGGNKSDELGHTVKYAKGKHVVVVGTKQGSWAKKAGMADDSFKFSTYIDK